MIGCKHIDGDRNPLINPGNLSILYMYKNIFPIKWLGERTCRCIFRLASVSLLLEGRIVASHQPGPWSSSLETQWQGMPVYVCMLLMYKDLNRVVALLLLMNREKSDCVAMYTSALMRYLFTSNPRCCCSKWCDEPCTASRGRREGRRGGEESVCVAESKSPCACRLAYPTGTVLWSLGWRGLSNATSPHGAHADFMWTLIESASGAEDHQYQCNINVSDRQMMAIIQLICHSHWPKTH